MYTIYGIKNCSTVKKALLALDEANITYDFFDYKKQQITNVDVAMWVEELGIDTVLNKRGTTWRKQTDEIKARADASITEAITLMVENTSMIKRPILVNNEKNILLAGFDVDKYAALV